MAQTKDMNKQEFGLLLSKWIKRLRDVYPDMTLLQLECLAEVIAKPGVSQRDILSSVDVSTSAISRTLAVLSELGDRKVGGLDLIRMEVNPQDRRERLVGLSPKGRRLIDDMIADVRAYQEPERVSS